MIPPSELEGLLLAIDEAEELAESGQAADGYLCLLLELNRAEDAQDAGKPWAEELARR